MINSLNEAKENVYYQESNTDNGGSKSHSSILEHSVPPYSKNIRLNRPVPELIYSSVDPSLLTTSLSPSKRAAPGIIGAHFNR